MKKCSKCQEDKPVEDFHRHKQMKDGRQSACKACSSKWYFENRERRVAIRMKSNYGLDAAAFRQLLEEQNDRCAICGTSRPETPSGAWCVDHDHGSGTIRGLLCFLCNSGLGHFRDRAELLRKALTYLETPPAPRIGITGKAAKWLRSSITIDE